MDMLYRASNKLGKDDKYQI